MPDSSKAIKDISARKPNDEVIKELEYLLEQAKAGELIGIHSVSYWHAGYVNHGWALDERADRFKMLGVGHYALNHFSSEIAEHCGDTPFLTEKDL